jgi:thiol-disulfide isomerase/thioredoxin
MKKISLLFLLAFSIFCQATELKPFKGTIKNPTLVLQDLNGNTQTLAQYKGKVVLLQFWATYCSPCVKEMPSMNNLQDKLKNLGVDFKILAVNMAESKEEVQAFVAKIKPEFSILLDESGESIQAWNVFAAPSNFLLDKQGVIKYTLFGGVEWDSQEMIENIMRLSEQ